MEASGFRDAHSKFVKKDLIVLGCSPDDIRTLKKFHEKFDFPFALLSDTDKRVAQAYGVWKEKNMYGKKVMGIERTTIVIDAEGMVQRVYAKVKPDGHAEQVLADLP